MTDWIWGAMRFQKSGRNKAFWIKSNCHTGNSALEEGFASNITKLFQYTITHKYVFTVVAEKMTPKNSKTNFAKKIFVVAFYIICNNFLPHRLFLKTAELNFFCSASPTTNLESYIKDKEWILFFPHFHSMNLNNISSRKTVY